MHALSDRALATFDLNPTFYGAADQVFEAISILEMARDIRAYDEVTLDKDSYGLQFVENIGARLEDSNVELRIVSSDRADSEDIVRRVKLPGRYETHLLSDNGDIYVVNQVNGIEMKDGYETWKQTLVMTRIRLLGKQGFLEDPELSQIELALSQEGFGYWGFYETIRTHLIEEGDKLIVSHGDQLNLVQKGAQIRLEGRADTQCLPKGRLSNEYKFLGDKVYLNYEIGVDTHSTQYDNVRLSRTFLVPLNEAYAVQCEQAVNIPGKAIRLEGANLVTEEQRFIGFYPDDGGDFYPANNESNTKGVRNQIFVPPYRWPNTARVLTGLLFNNKRAELKDIYALSGNVGEVLVHDALYTIEQAQEWAPRFISKISFNGERFDRLAYRLPSAQIENSWPQLSSVLDGKKGPLFLIQEGAQARIYATAGGQIRALEVRVVKEHELAPASHSFLLPEWLDPFLRNQRIDFDGNGRLAIAQGLYGVVEVQLNE